MNHIEDKKYTEDELLFKQNGRSVFKEVSHGCSIN